MSKFKRVGESEQLPNFVKSAFFEDNPTIQRDPYADLKSEAESYKTKIASKTMDVRSDAPSPWLQAAQNYESRNKPNIYNQEEASSFNPAMNASTVRRSSFATDNGLNARDTDRTFFLTEDQAMDMQVSGRGYSMWHPFYNEMAALTKTAAISEGMFEKRSREEIREEQNTAWEKEHLAALNRQVRPRTVMSSRSYIQRPNYNTTATNSFGFMTPEDYASLDMETERRQKDKVEAKFASNHRYKRTDLTEQERRATWEHNQAATTYQDTNATWVDDILGGYGRR